MCERNSGAEIYAIYSTGKLNVASFKVSVSLQRIARCLGVYSVKMLCNALYLYKLYTKHVE